MYVRITSREKNLRSPSSEPIGWPARLRASARLTLTFNRQTRTKRRH